MAKKITLKNKNGDVLCPHTAIEQVQGLKEALDNKLGKTEKAVSAKATKVSKSSEADPNFALSFYAGQAETSTTPTADKVYVGSSVDPNIISVPFLGGTTSMANYMNLRMSFNSRYFHEIAVLPNSDGIYHRNVRNGNAIEWEQLAYKSDVDSKLGKTEKAASATKLSTSTYVGEDLNTFNFTDGSARYYGVIPPTASNMPDAKGWQNSVMCFGLNENGATAQMFFAKDKPLYYRSSQTGEWQQIAYKSDVDKAFNYLGYNLDLNEFYDNENKSGIVYVHIHDGAENTINAPERQGSAVNFGAGASNFQLFSPANSNKLYHRNRWWSDGGGKWTDWKQLRTMNDLVTTSHIADTSITSEKLAQSLILRGTPQLATQPTLSSESQNIASVGLVKEAVADLEIDTRNLIPNSESIVTGSHTTSVYHCKQIKLPVGIKNGESYSFNCDSIMNTAGAATEYSLILYDLPNSKAASNYIHLTTGNKVGYFTATRDVAVGSAYIFLYAGKYGATAGNNVTYINCSLVKGDKPMLLWQAAPEDMVSKKYLGEFEIGGTNLVPVSDFEIGGLGDYGVAVAGDNRVRSKNYIQISSRKISAKSWVSGKYGILLYFYNSSKTYIKTSYADKGWFEECQAYAVPEGTAFIKVVIMHSDNSTFVGTDLSSIKIKVENGDKITDWSPAPEDIVNGIEIGGANLLRYIKDDGSSYWESRGTCNVTITNEVIRCNANGSSYPRIMNASVKDVNWEPNAQYVLSYYARGEGEYARRVGIVDINAANGVLPLHTDGVYTSEWKKYVYSFTTPSVLPNIEALLLQIYCANIEKGDTTSWLEIKDIKIEKGNKATDWSPAPEDLITYTDTKIDNLEIDTRNLLSDSEEITIDGSALTSGTKYEVRKLPISVAVGDVLTFNCEDLIINAGTGQTHAIVLRVPGVGALAPMQWISPTSKTATITVTQASDTPHLYIYAGYADDSAGKSITYKGATLVKGTKPMLLWQPAPEDINTEISNAETRSKAHAEDYTNAEIDKIENGDIVAQKANSLYDADSNKYKNWGEIDTAITRKIGDKFEDYATKSYVQGEISKQVAVPIASETEDGKVKLATPEDVTAVENDISAVNDSAKAVTPYTLKEYIASKNFATSGDISSAVTAAKTTIFFQVAQPAGGKDGDIWIKP